MKNPEFLWYTLNEWHITYVMVIKAKKVSFTSALALRLLQFSVPSFVSHAVLCNDTGAYNGASENSSQYRGIIYGFYNLV